MRIVAVAFALAAVISGVLVARYLETNGATGSLFMLAPPFLFVFLFMTAFMDTNRTLGAFIRRSARITMLVFAFFVGVIVCMQVVMLHIQILECMTVSGTEAAMRDFSGGKRQCLPVCENRATIRNFFFGSPVSEHSYADTLAKSAYVEAYNSMMGDLADGLAKGQATQSAESDGSAGSD